jgi:hypothetical protein
MISQKGVRKITLLLAVLEELANSWAVQLHQQLWFYEKH